MHFVKIDCGGFSHRQTMKALFESYVTRLCTVRHANQGMGLLQFERRAAKLAKIMGLVTAAWSFLCALLVFGWQVSLWLQTGIWNWQTLSSVFNDNEVTGAVYQTASASKPTLVDELLEIPTIVPLLVATALFLAFSIWTAALEKRSSGS